MSGNTHLMIGHEVANSQVSAESGGSEYARSVLAKPLRQILHRALGQGIRTEHDWTGIPTAGAGGENDGAENQKFSSSHESTMAQGFDCSQEHSLRFSLRIVQLCARETHRGDGKAVRLGLLGL